MIPPPNTGERPRLALRLGPASLVELCAGYLTEYLDKIRLACVGLDDEQIWSRVTEHSNSIGNLMLHLSGNLSLWILVTLGGRAFERDRPAEFAARRTASGVDLIRQLEAVVTECRDVIGGLDSAALERRSMVQGYEANGLAVLLHAVEHMSYHTGQIVWMAKATRDRSGDRLEFYPHLLDRGSR